MFQTSKKASKHFKIYDNWPYKGRSRTKVHPGQQSCCPRLHAGLETLSCRCPKRNSSAATGLSPTSATVPSLSRQYATTSLLSRPTYNPRMCTRKFTANRLLVTRTTSFVWRTMRLNRKSEDVSGVSFARILSHCGSTEPTFGQRSFEGRCTFTVLDVYSLLLKWISEYAVRAYGTTPDSTISYLNHAQIDNRIN